MMKKQIFSLAWPLVLANLFAVVFTIVDMFWIGKISTDALAAVGTGSVLDTILIGFGVGGSIAAMAMVSRYIGAMDQAKAERAAWNALIFAIILAIPITIVGLIFAKPALELMGLEGKILELATKYIKILIVGYVFQLLYFYSSDIFRGTGNVLTPTLALGIGVGLNIVLDPIFIFGWGFIPELGVSGAALATILTRAISSSLMLYLLIRGTAGIRLKPQRVNPWVLKELLSVGLPASGERMLLDLSHVIFMALVIRFGKIAVGEGIAISAYTIVTRLRQLALTVGFGLGMASAILVGQHMGAGKPDEAEKATWLTLRYYEFFTIPLSLIFIFFSPYFISIFTTESQVVEIGSTYLRISAIALPILAISLIFLRSMCGAGDTFPPFILRLIFPIGFRIGIAIMLATHFSIDGLWWAVSISQIIEGGFALAVFKAGRWKYKVKFA